ncbi:MAG: hypothetical protein ABI624_21475 [Casimicrobiaceae bacterium]
MKQANFALVGQVVAKEPGAAADVDDVNQRVVSGAHRILEARRRRGATTVAPSPQHRARDQPLALVARRRFPGVELLAALGARYGFLDERRFDDAERTACVGEPELPFPR